MKVLTFCVVFLVLLATAASAQAPQFTVERDSAGFLLVQSEGRTRFDTAFVSQSLREKIAQETELKSEADLIERLLSIRRSMAIVRDEKRILTEILSKAKQCVPSH